MTIIQKRIILIILFSCLSFFTVQCQQVPTITPADVVKMLLKDSSVVLLDVRTKSEFDEDGHLKGAILIPIQELQDRINELDFAKSKKIIAYCRSGRRSGIATSLLQSKGFSVVNLDGGIVRWKAEHLSFISKNVQPEIKKK